MTGVKYGKAIKENVKLLSIRRKYSSTSNKNIEIFFCFYINLEHKSKEKESKNIALSKKIKKVKRLLFEQRQRK